ncbi:DUF3887 domain-containing protein [Streptomyces boncukensis]|uniref:DUF3887 domain-containing protein n=1 Tax=Streptomyces boncukensis TaxID=2711219 RepID=A0A6G4WVS3_9ACTN|nr:DUF3887 domain-containing protein [Streptomyces boncukensis]NGO68571.1 DUF3887 domain-containing protein [Streptomyces boncukensis]
MTESAPPLFSLSARLAEQAAALAATLGTDGPDAPPDHGLDAVRRARDIDALAKQVLTLCVQRSRAAGHTWQEVGDLLGVTRQAAFQRFGRPIDPRTGDPMDRTAHMADAAERARQIVTDVLEGRMDAARRSFNAEVRAAFTDEARGEALATVAGLVGAFEGFGAADPFVRRIGDHTAVDVPLCYEAGEMKARLTFDAGGKVAGIFFLAPDAP